MWRLSYADARHMKQHAIDRIESKPLQIVLKPNAAFG